MEETVPSTVWLLRPSNREGAESVCKVTTLQQPSGSGPGAANSQGGSLPKWYYSIGGEGKNSKEITAEGPPRYGLHVPWSWESRQRARERDRPLDRQTHTRVWPRAKLLVLTGPVNGPYATQQPESLLFFQKWRDCRIRNTKTEVLRGNDLLIETEDGKHEGGQLAAVRALPSVNTLPETEMGLLPTRGSSAARRVCDPTRYLTPRETATPLR